MKTSKKGIELIHSWEQFRSKAYQDSGGVWTIGWGSTRIFGRSVRRGDRITKEDANEQFEKDLHYFENAVDSYVNVDINQNQFDALVSLTYNIGAGNLASSTLLKRLNRKDYSGAGRAFTLYVNCKGKVLRGLVRRRKAEKKLFLSVKPDFSKLKPRGLTPYIIRWERLFI